jgi:hypothetical protein
MITTDLAEIVSEIGTTNTTLDLILADQVGEVSFLAAVAALEASLAAIETTVGTTNTILGVGFGAIAVQLASVIAILTANNAAQTTTNTTLASINTQLVTANSTLATMSFLLNLISTNTLTANTTLSATRTDLRTYMADSTSSGSVFRYTDQTTGTPAVSVFKAITTVSGGSSICSTFNQSGVGFTTAGDVSAFVEQNTNLTVGSAALIEQTIAPKLTVPPSYVHTSIT